MAVDDTKLVRALKALADAKRFRMVQEVADAGELNCGQVAAKFDLSQPTISHHLKILMDAGILVQRADGQQHILSVDQEFLGQIAEMLPTRLADSGPRRARRAK